MFAPGVAVRGSVFLPARSECSLRGSRCGGRSPQRNEVERPGGRYLRPGGPEVGRLVPLSEHVTQTSFLSEHESPTQFSTLELVGLRPWEPTSPNEPSFAGGCCDDLATVDW